MPFKNCFICLDRGRKRRKKTAKVPNSLSNSVTTPSDPKPYSEPIYMDISELHNSPSASPTTPKSNRISAALDDTPPPLPPNHPSTLPKKKPPTPKLTRWGAKLANSDSSPLPHDLNDNIPGALQLIMAGGPPPLPEDRPTTHSSGISKSRTYATSPSSVKKGGNTPNNYQEEPIYDDPSQYRNSKNYNSQSGSNSPRRNSSTRSNNSNIIESTYL